MSQADSFRLRADAQGQVVLEFGHLAQPTVPGVPIDPATAFVASDRIVMAPDVARRLVDGLGLALGRPVPPAEEKLPAPAAAAPPPAPLRQPPRAALRPGARVLSLDSGADPSLRQRASTPLNASPDPAGETAAWLMNAVTEMAPGHYQERSFRIAPQSLQAHRFLLSISARQMPADAFERSWAICRHLGLPASLRTEIEAGFLRADHVHFGFEGEPGKVMCKLYLERTVSGLEAAQSRQTGEPALQYVAYKWRPDGLQHVVSHYRWFAGLSPAGIEERLTRLCGAQSPALFELARSVLDTAAQRLPPDRLLYLEVSEQGQPRQSFDLNLYDARLLVRDLQPVLFAMRDHFELPPGQFQALYDQIKSRPMGHLAGGIHRDGQAFFNVYFGGTRPG